MAKPFRITSVRVSGSPLILVKHFAMWFFIADLCAHPEQILHIASKKHYRSTDASLRPQNHQRIANCSTARHNMFAGPFIAQKWGWLHKRLWNVSRRKRQSGDSAASTYRTIRISTIRKVVKSAAEIVWGNPSCVKYIAGVIPQSL